MQSIQNFAMMAGNMRQMSIDQNQKIMKWKL
jgi:hypothetical protein